MQGQKGHGWKITREGPAGWRTASSDSLQPICNRLRSRSDGCGDLGYGVNGWFTQPFVLRALAYIPLSVRLAMGTPGPRFPPHVLARLPEVGQGLLVVRSTYHLDFNVLLLSAIRDGGLWEVIVLGGDPITPEVGTLFWIMIAGTPNEDNLGTWLLKQHESRVAVCVLVCDGYRMGQ